MTTDGDGTPDYARAANLLVRLAADVEAEFGAQSDTADAVDQARRLYETHGPFEIDFGWPHPDGGPEWYDGE